MTGTSKHIYDFAIVGAGIAGASVAAELAQHATVLLIEREAQAGYHSTGRSAAMYIPSYGPAPIQAFTKASGHFFNNPPEVFGPQALLNSRYELLIARNDQLATLNDFYNSCRDNEAIELLSANQVKAYCPLLKDGYAQAGVLDTSGCDIDAHNLHQGYLNWFKQLGGTITLNTEVKELIQLTDDWSIETNGETYYAKTIINASGAWADEVAKLANSETIGITPKRRTALTIELDDPDTLNSMPLTADIDEAFYIKPDAGRLLLSPANEDPMPPCDVQPEELDIAICVDRIEKAFDIRVKNIVSQWAGLRNFVAGGSPVVGYSSSTEGFFWLAGQGGYGIQSSPALARYAAALALGNELPADILRHGLVPQSVAADRVL